MWAIIRIRDHGIYVTNDLGSVSPTWAEVNTGLAAGDISTMNKIAFDGDSTLYLSCDTGIFKNTNIFGGGTWSSVLTAAAAVTILNAEGASCGGNPIPLSPIGTWFVEYDRTPTDPLVRQLTFSAGGDLHNTGCGLYRRPMYTLDDFVTAHMGADLDWHGHGSIWTINNMSVRQGKTIFASVCGWGFGSDCSLWQSNDMSATATQKKNIAWTTACLYTARAQHKAIFYYDNGLEVSEDDGETFTPVNLGLFEAVCRTPCSLAISELDVNQAMLCGTAWGGATILSHSEDGGYTWHHEDQSKFAGMGGGPLPVWTVGAGYRTRNLFGLGFYWPGMDKYFWITRDNGTTYENKSGNLSSFGLGAYEVVDEVVLDGTAPGPGGCPKIYTSCVRIN